MNFTDSPFERLMEQPPCTEQREKSVKPPLKCRKCPYWIGRKCDICIHPPGMASGHLGPKFAT